MVKAERLVLLREEEEDGVVFTNFRKSGGIWCIFGIKILLSRYMEGFFVRGLYLVIAFLFGYCLLSIY